MTLLETDVSAAASGDREAYRRLVDHTRGLVSAVCFAQLHDPAASEDLAQDVYLAAWQGLPALREPKSFLPWLRQLARNRARHARDAARLRPVPTEDEVLAAATDPRPGPAELLLSTEERRRLEDALGALDADDREVLILYYREGQSIAQAAALLEVSEDAAKKRLSRARARLREDLLERLGEVAERSAPGDRFSAAVLAALPLGAPTVAAAKAAAGAVVAHTLPVVAASGAGFGLGALGAYFGYRRMDAGAVDDLDRREGRRIFHLTLAATAAFSLGASGVVFAGLGVGAVAALCGAFLAAMIYLGGVRTIALVRRRAELTAATDPRAWAKFRRARALAITGLTMGSLCTAGVLLYLARL